MARTMPTITMEWLEARCTRTDCGCLVWKGYIDPKRSATHPGTQEAPKARPTRDCNPIPVRRLVWKLKTGKAPRPKDRIARSCDTYGCVEPACLECFGPTDKLRERPLPMSHRAKLARSLRALGRSGLDAAQVAQIRAADTTCEQEAKARGVGETTIAEIRRGTRWRDYEGNPWQTLLR